MDEVARFHAGSGGLVAALASAGVDRARLRATERRIRAVMYVCGRPA